MTKSVSGWRMDLELEGEEEARKEVMWVKEE